ncbi:MAG TPA: hypothetical protein DCQ29_07310, partial [Chitinophagaceae bacterium]|nr:hypothetical protein [Chitinophagaceae bacterium]
MKRFHFICILIVYTTLIASSVLAQNTLDNAGLTSASPPASAYSLRKLSSSYSGNAVQVRRSSDNTTQDIGFTVSGNLDTTTLKTFVGSGNGFITIWYDQSGNGRNLTVTSASNQPSIINAGVIYRRSEQPAVYFDGDDGMFFSGSDYLTALPLSVSVVAGSNSSSTGFRRAVQGTNNWLIGPYGNTHGWYASGWNHQIAAPWSLTRQEVFTVIEPTTASCTSWRNGVSQTSSNNKGVPLKLQMGIYGAYNEPLNGFISEAIAMNVELTTTERQNLENNQSVYYPLILSTNANLSALSLSTGTLSPTFASGTTSYTANVSNAATTVTVTPTREHSGATIQVRVNSGTYTTVTSGNASGNLTLNMGNNTIDVLVTAQDGSTTRTYTITVTREIAPPTITSFSPLAAKPGDAVTITGTNFNTTLASNIVFFGATKATVTAATETSITATVPTGATYAPISVLNTIGGFARSSTVNFTPMFSPVKSGITTTDFAAKQDFLTTWGPSSVAIGDVDGD